MLQIKMPSTLQLGTSERGKWRYDKKSETFVDVDEERYQELHSVHQDTMDEVQSPISFDKKKFTSRSAYERHLKEKGFEITGKITDGQHFTREREKEEQEEKERLREMEEAFHKIKNNEEPFTEEEKQLHIEEERKCRANGINPKLKPIK